MGKFIVFIFLTTSIFSASDIYSKFKDPKKLAVFNKVSDRLVCQCGCQTVLSQCTHSTCLAWTTRATIEGLIESGHDEHFIVNGFQNGFHTLVKNDKAFLKVLNQPSDVIKDFERGYGLAVLSQPEGRYPEALIVIVALVLTFIVLLYLKRRKKTIPTQLLSEKEQEEMMKDLYSKE